MKGTNGSKSKRFGVTTSLAAPTNPNMHAPFIKVIFHIVAIALAYAALALIARLFALDPGHISPIWPAAGLALVAMLLCGKRCWPGVWLGAFVSFPGFALSSEWLLLSSAVASGATLQGLVGAALVQKLFRRSVPLAQEVDLFQFLLRSGPVACLISATFGLLAI